MQGFGDAIPIERGLGDTSPSLIEVEIKTLLMTVYF